MRKIRLNGKCCYDHLGGKLGSLLFDFYVSNDWIEREEGKKSVYVVTEKGKFEFMKMGLKIPEDFF